jgi:hypothetical protein
MNPTPAPAAPVAQSSSKPPRAGERAAADGPAIEDSDFAGWHVSSVELREGVTVVDLDDPALRELFGV